MVFLIMYTLPERVWTDTVNMYNKYVFGWPIYILYFAYLSAKSQEQKDYNVFVLNTYCFDILKT